MIVITSLRIRPFCSLVKLISQSVRFHWTEWLLVCYSSECNSFVIRTDSPFSSNPVRHCAPVTTTLFTLARSSDKERNFHQSKSFLFNRALSLFPHSFHSSRNKSCICHSYEEHGWVHPLGPTFSIQRFPKWEAQPALPAFPRARTSLLQFAWHHSASQYIPSIAKNRRPLFPARFLIECSLTHNFATFSDSTVDCQWSIADLQLPLAIHEFS